MTEAVEQRERGRRVFRLLMVAFIAQIAGRVVDLQWHATHREFEGGAEQLQAHWLIWLATILVIVVAAIGWRDVTDQPQRRAYSVILVANLAYAAVAVIHFFQHLNHLEVDWAHALLAATNIVAVLGVVWVIAARSRVRPPQSRRDEA